jgi:membrane fusion protein (multidrug efflux system)
MRVIIAPLALLLLAGCGSKEEKTTKTQQAGVKQPPIAVEAYIAKPQTISDNVQVPGSILAFESTEIHPEISGRVVILNVKEGGFVNKGALLAKIYDGDLQAQLKKLEVQLDIAQQTESRSSQLLKIQGISQQDYDLSLLSVNNIKADIDITRAAISKTTVRAPFNGKLGLKNISPGAFITPTTVITTIGQVSQLKLQFTVPEKYGAQIKNGQDIQFTIDGSSNTYHAAVSATEVGITEDTRSLLVRAVVKGKDPLLIPGAFAKVVIVLGKNDNALMIPSGAITPQGRKKLIFLYKGGKALLSEITIGVRDSSNVEATTGLNNGDTVITTGLLFLKPGSDVKLTKVNTLNP